MTRTRASNRRTHRPRHITGASPDAPRRRKCSCPAGSRFSIRRCVTVSNRRALRCSRTRRRRSQSSSSGWASTSSRPASPGHRPVISRASAPSRPPSAHPPWPASPGRVAKTSTPPGRRLPAPGDHASTSFSPRARSTWRRSSASSPRRSCARRAGLSSTRPSGPMRSSSRARTRPGPIPRSSPASAAWQSRPA